MPVNTVATRRHIAVALTLTLTCDLETPKPCHFYGIPTLQTLNTLGSFAFELCSSQANSELEHPTRADQLCRCGNYVICYAFTCSLLCILQP